MNVSFNTEVFNIWIWSKKFSEAPLFSHIQAKMISQLSIVEETGLPGEMATNLSSLALLLIFKIIIYHIQPNSIKTGCKSPLDEYRNIFFGSI